MRNILLVIKNNLYRLSKETIIIGMLIIVLPLVVYGGIYFAQIDIIKGKIVVVGANSQEKESIESAIIDNEKIDLLFLDKSPSKTELIKGIYLAEINLTKDEPEVISYGKEEVKKSLEASIKGEIYLGTSDKATIQGKIIGFLTMFLLIGSIMVMDFFLTDRENGVYVRVLLGRMSYGEYMTGQILYSILVLTVPAMIMSLLVLKILSVQLSISTGIFALLILLVGLLSSSFSILISTFSKNIISASMVGSAITVITSLLGGSIVNIVDSNKIIGFLRNCLPQKRLIDLANNYNNQDLIFLSIIILVFISISLFIGKRQYENGVFV